MIATKRLFGFALTIVIAALPASAFDPLDISGSWYAMGMEAHSGGNAPVLVEAWVYVPQFGFITGTWTTYGDSAPANQRDINGGALTVDAAGRVNGTLELSDGSTVAIENFQMNEGTDFVSGVTTPQVNSPGILTMVKQGYDYVNADLAGAWRVFGFYESIAEHDPGYIEGLLALTEHAQTGQGSYWFFQHEARHDIPADFDLSLTAQGAVTFDELAAGDLLLRLASGKNLMIGRGIGWQPGGEGEQRLYLLVKGSEDFVPADLAGSWRTSTFYDTQSEIDPGNSTGRLTVDETGTEVPTGSFEYNEGGTDTLTGGSLTPDGATGEFDVALQYVSGMTASGSFHASPGGDVVFGYTTDSEGYSNLYSAVKAPEASTGLLGLAGLLSLAGLRRSRRR